MQHVCVTERATHTIHVHYSWYDVRTLHQVHAEGGTDLNAKGSAGLVKTEQTRTSP